jgi:hypothetical protein
VSQAAIAAIHDPSQIVGQDGKRHFGGYFRKRFGEEVRSPHVGLQDLSRLGSSRQWREITIMIPDTYQLAKCSALAVRTKR